MRLWLSGLLKGSLDHRREGRRRGGEWPPPARAGNVAPGGAADNSGVTGEALGDVIRFLFYFEYGDQRANGILLRSQEKCISAYSELPKDLRLPVGFSWRKQVFAPTEVWVDQHPDLSSLWPIPMSTSYSETILPNAEPSRVL